MSDYDPVRANIERSRTRAAPVESVRSDAASVSSDSTTGRATEQRPKLARGTIAKRQKRVKEKAMTLPKGPI